MGRRKMECGREDGVSGTVVVGRWTADGDWGEESGSWALIVVLGADESINNYDWCRSHFQMFLHGFTLEGRVRS